MYYLYLCICTSANCMSVELKVNLFIWSHNFRFAMSLSLSPNSLYRQTTDCTEGGGLTREHCTFIVFNSVIWLVTVRPALKDTYIYYESLSMKDSLIFLLSSLYKFNLYMKGTFSGSLESPLIVFVLLVYLSAIFSTQGYITKC